MFSATHLHAMIVHFPIALLIVGFLSQVIALFTQKPFFKQAAFYLLLVGALGAGAAYLSGDYAGEGIEEGPLEGPIELHEQAALITLWLAIVAAAFQVVLFYFKYDRTWTRLVNIVIFTVLVGAVARTGYLGGQLVYSHGAGVEFGLPGIGGGADSAEEDHD